MRVSVSDLNLPTNAQGARLLGQMMKAEALQATRAKTYDAYVTDATPTSTGRIRVLVDGTATTARLTSTAKAVQTGDTVKVVKHGGIYEVVGSKSYREPPDVSGSMGSKPPSASTVYGSDLPGVGRPTPFSPSQDLAVISSRIQSIRTRQRDDADRLHEIHQRINAIQSAINTNASRLNQTRDYAESAGNLVEPVVGALRDEGIVR